MQFHRIWHPESAAMDCMSRNLKVGDVFCRFVDSAAGISIRKVWVRALSQSCFTFLEYEIAKLYMKSSR